MILLIFLFVTTLSFDVVRTTANVESSKIKAPEISPKLDTPVKHIEDPVPPVLPHYTEGGALRPKNETNKVISGSPKTNKEPTLSSPVDDKKALKTLPESLEKEGVIAKSNIKARKGADNLSPASDPVVPASSDLPLKLNDTSKSNPTNASIVSTNSNITSSHSKNATVVAATKPEKQNLPTELVHKKPLVLNAVDLDEFNAVPAAEVEQREGHLRSSKISTANAHPNLVIPVTITVFALPLFAVLGYYALKHGREAWKNRHYRRMDFLLDGMYND